MYNSQGLYRPGKGWLYTLHPVAKLLSMLLLQAAVLIGASLPGSIFSLIIPLIAAFHLKILPPLVKFLIRLFLIFGLVLIAVHGVFHPLHRTPQEGILYAVHLLIKILSSVSIAALFLFTTKNNQLMSELERRGMPHYLVYIILTVVKILPEMIDKTESIRRAQEARGLKIKGNIFHRFKVMIYMLRPLFYGQMAFIDERAVALEIRGFFHTRKSQYYTADFISADYILIVLSAMGVLFSGSIRIWS